MLQSPPLLLLLIQALALVFSDLSLELGIFRLELLLALELGAQFHYGALELHYFLGGLLHRCHAAATVVIIVLYVVAGVCIGGDSQSVYLVIVLLLWDLELVVLGMVHVTTLGCCDWGVLGGWAHVLWDA